MLEIDFQFDMHSKRPKFSERYGMNDNLVYALQLFVDNTAEFRKRDKNSEDSSEILNTKFKVIFVFDKLF